VSFRVRLTAEAEGDLDRLFDFVVERELQHDGGDLELAAAVARLTRWASSSSPTL
jgi:hypothetical protein